MAITTNLKLRDKRVISLVSDIFVDQTDSIRSLEAAMNSSNSGTAQPLDPDIYDWCSEYSRSERIFEELKGSISLLLWHGNLPEVVKSWVKRELIQSTLDSKSLWSTDLQEIIQSY